MTIPQTAVLTGDLVGSTAHPAERIETAMRAIREAASGISAWHSPVGDTRFTRFRGDGWQIVLAAPLFALRAAAVIQGRLVALGLESRISIGIGPAETLGSQDLSDAAGDAFETSGRGLDRMPDAARLAIAGEGVIEQDRIIADLLGERMGRWTAPQAQATAMQLASPDRPPTLHEIGAALGISPQAVNDRLRGAGGQTIASALRRWEAAKARGTGPSA